MPDWFYRTVAQRALFALPDRKGRAVALGIIGALGRSGPGRAAINFLGHMHADPRLAVRVGGVHFPSPFGLGWRVDPELRATHGLACFGAGCIEIRPEFCDVDRQPGETLGESAGRPRPAAIPEEVGCPILRRVRTSDGREQVQLPTGLVLPVHPWDAQPVAGLPGVVLQVGQRNAAGAWQVPAEPPSGLAENARLWRSTLPPDAPMIVAGGVAGPDDALGLLAAGADLVLLDAGLVFRGPGLLKRCNEALLAAKSPRAEVAPETAIFRQAWVWAAALGLALALGGLAALALAVTRVLLPYDEHYLGITADVLKRNSPRLFAFMAHDRGTLAGTMVGLGWLYLALAGRGIRRGVHGARTAVVASALAGFASFFGFFGFGYFDTLHAFVAAMLFQITVQIMVGSEGTGVPSAGSDPEDAAWRRAQWGQLLWVIHAVGLLGAGGVILGIGMTSVFVQEDLNFLCVTEVQARDFGDRLIAVVAHDRATLGGMLLASGVAMLLPVLWCHRRGARWLWFAIAGLGFPAYLAAIGLHLWVGYTDARHMLPALAGAALWLGGLALSWSYLRRGSRA